MNKAFSNLLSAVEKAKAGSPVERNEATWYPERDRSGNAFAVIRFLPAKTDDDVPFVKVYDHGFQGPQGKWYIEKCPTTVGETCPCCEGNSVLWNSGVDSDKEIARKRKRRTSYYANILVVSDPKNPENEGKVFLYKFGAKIFDKIVDKIQPQFEDEKPMNPFDPLEGANFKLKVRQVEGYPNYDKSEFDEPSKIEAKLKDLTVQMFDLNALTDKSTYKSYDDLAKKYAFAVGAPTTPRGKASEDNLDEDDTAFVAKTTQKKVAAKKDEGSASGEDDDLDYFKRLAEED